MTERARTPGLPRQAGADEPHPAPPGGGPGAGQRLLLGLLPGALAARAGAARGHRHLPLLRPGLDRAPCPTWTRTSGRSRSCSERRRGGRGAHRLRGDDPQEVRRSHARLPALRHRHDREAGRLPLRRPLGRAALPARRGQPDRRRRRRLQPRLPPVDRDGEVAAPGLPGVRQRGRGARDAVAHRRLGQRAALDRPLPGRAGPLRRAAARVQPRRHRGADRGRAGGCWTAW